MPRTLTDEDIDAIAERVVVLVAMRLGGPAAPPAPPAPTSMPVSLPPKLAFTKRELAVELGMSPASIFRLEQRGLLRSVPGLRTKLFSRKEVERYLALSVNLTD